MLNSRPNNSRYSQGNYIPNNPDKLLKLNKEGGVYFRSGLEKKFMIWLDNKKEIIKWGAECLKIPYQMKHFDNGDIKLKEHCYFPDFYYEMRLADDTTKYVVVEVKPMKEYKMVINLNEGNLNVPTNGLKKLKNFEYDIKMAYQNQSKWQTMIKWCNIKGYEFIVVTEEHLKKI
jgi:hypothetical protein